MTSPITTRTRNTSVLVPGAGFEPALHVNGRGVLRALTWCYAVRLVHRVPSDLGSVVRPVRRDNSSIGPCWRVLCTSCAPSGLRHDWVEPNLRHHRLNRASAVSDEGENDVCHTQMEGCGGMSEPKRHHFVPRFYLARWSVEDTVAVRRRDGGRFEANPTKVAAINGFYDFRADDGEVSKEVERFLAHVVEGPASSALDAIDASGRPPARAATSDTQWRLSLRSRWCARPKGVRR